uniref:Prolyl 4-hydroxylase N-terminal domain-containing protein n=1 Tax=Strigamia maritima TaxID=126957 RepID=T1ILC1_STRMM
MESSEISAPLYRGGSAATLAIKLIVNTLIWPMVRSALRISEDPNTQEIKLYLEEAIKANSKLNKIEQNCTVIFQLTFSAQCGIGKQNTVCLSPGTPYSLFQTLITSDKNMLSPDTMTLFALLLLIPILGFNGEIYTSPTHLASVLNAQRDIIKHLEKMLKPKLVAYEIITYSKCFLPKRYIVAFNGVQGAGNVDEVIGNPLSAYQLIKQLVHSWESVEQFLSRSSSQVELRGRTNRQAFASGVRHQASRRDTIQKIQNRLQDVRMPQEEDLQGVAFSILRLQETYQLDVSDLARGNILEIQSPIGLTSLMIFNTRDCIYMGKRSSHHKFYDLAIEW